MQFTQESGGGPLQLLDLGGGIAGPACDWAVNDHRLHIDSITISSVQQRIATSRIAERGLADRVQSITGDYHRLSELVAENAYDGAIFMETIGYAHNLTAVFEGVAKSLRTGARIFLKEVCRPEGEFTAGELAAFEDMGNAYGGTYHTNTGTRRQSTRVAKSGREFVLGLR